MKISLKRIVALTLFFSITLTTLGVVNAKNFTDNKIKTINAFEEVERKYVKISSEYQKALEIIEFSSKDEQEKSRKKSKLKKEFKEKYKKAGFDFFEVNKKNKKEFENVYNLDLSEVVKEDNVNYDVIKVDIPVYEEKEESILSSLFGINEVHAVDTWYYSFLYVTSSDSPDLSQISDIETEKGNGLDSLNDIVQGTVDLVVGAATEYVWMALTVVKTAGSAFGVDWDIIKYYPFHKEVLNAGSAWTKKYVLVRKSTSEPWAYGVCTEYANTQIWFDEYYYDPDTNFVERSTTDNFKYTTYAEHYDDTAWLFEQAKVGYQIRTIYDLTGDIKYEHKGKTITHYQPY